MALSFEEAFEAEFASLHRYLRRSVGPPRPTILQRRPSLPHSQSGTASTRRARSVPGCTGSPRISCATTGEPSGGCFAPTRAPASILS